MTDNSIFGFGVFVTLLLFAGVVLTYLEFRKMGKYPERYGPLNPSSSDSRTP